MILETWFAFALACSVVLIVPGPTILMVVSYGLSQGRRSAIASMLGVMLGDFIAITASVAGLGALLATSATLFSLLKYLGAAYLIWLGISMWRSNGGLGKALEMPKVSRRKIFRDTLLVTTFNPKGMLFFVAFIPQFIDPLRPLFMQFVVMDLTFVLLGGVNVLFWVAMAGGMRKVVSGPVAQRRLNRIGGTGLLSAGLFTAFSGRLV